MKIKDRFTNRKTAKKMITRNGRSSTHKLRKVLVSDFFVLLIFKEISSIKFKRIHVTRYLTVSLQGPVLTLRRGVERRAWWGGVRWYGIGRSSKVFFNFFILRYIKHYAHIYLNLFIKTVRTNFLWVLNIGQVGCLDKKTQNHPLG